MKKPVLIASLLASVALSFGSTIAFAGEAYINYGRDQSAMSGQSIMDLGSAARMHSEKVIASSRADQARSGVGVNYDHQFGSSQTEQSWKAVKSPDKAPVTGLVAGDCRGDNTSDEYRKQMGQSRDGYMKENLVSQKDCEVDHATVGGTGAPTGH
ncbi:MAG: hypothetical protein A3K09_05540 [Nitrospinae bacterium RIFCSPLOWO2_12_FULL_47_7]|nr:MAG: hypothetical protein A3K09_05540 [Nitrospinae bacterium RIFCSPLOWO2_12_FULL_47_7]